MYLFKQSYLTLFIFQNGFQVSTAAFCTTVLNNIEKNKKQNRKRKKNSLFLCVTNKKLQFIAALQRK